MTQPLGPKPTRIAGEGYEPKRLLETAQPSQPQPGDPSLEMTSFELDGGRAEPTTTAESARHFAQPPEVIDGGGANG